MRCPEPGRVKTRLAATTGAQFALELYVKLLKRTLAVVTDFKSVHPGCDVFIFSTPDHAAPSLQADFPGPWRMLPQPDGHLGQRMDRAFQTCWDQGYGEAVLVGTDLCDLQSSDLEAAFRELRNAHAVLGPAADGGFYLVGLKPLHHHAFRPTTWGTPTVYARTRKLLRSAGCILRTVPLRHDLDEADDLNHIRHDPLFQSRLSVIVPTILRPEALQPFLMNLRTGLWPGDEIVVVTPAPGGAAEIANHPIAPPDTDILSRTLCQVWSRVGRGRQLNTGVRASSGDLLWFLHDDCLPPADFAYHIRTSAGRRDTALGCFLLGFQPSNTRLDRIAAWANLRTRLFKRPYGDQGLFCRRNIYEHIGGFSRPMLMEDVTFVQAAMALGPLEIVPRTIHTSPSRYLERGIWKASMHNHLLILLHHLGVDDSTLHRLYYGNRSPHS